MATYSKLLSLINGADRTVDFASNTLLVQSLSLNGTILSTNGAAVIGDTATYMHFTPTSATIAGDLAGIDAALGSLSSNAITALTGDATASGPGSATLTLATVNSNVGSFGSASSVATFTVNAKGLITAAGSTSIQIAESQVTGLAASLALYLPLTGWAEMLYRTFPLLLWVLAD